MKILNALPILLLSFGTLQAQVPTTLHHQGRIAVDNVNFDGTGQFKFLLYHGPASGTISSALWKNDDSTPANGNEPATNLDATLTKGLYSINLGQPPQQPITADLTPGATTNLYLRIWFNDGTNGFQLLSPDQKISAVPFARHADLSSNNISELNNDAGFLTDANLPTNLMAEGENISLLNNDANYLTSASLPANLLESGDNISLLNNNAGYLTSIPGTYLQDNDKNSRLLNDSGYLTSIAGLNVSLLTNNANYLSGNGNVSINGDLSAGGEVNFGPNNTTSGTNSMAWGRNHTASGTRATTWGDQNAASAFNATSWGNGNYATGNNSTAFGFINTAGGNLTTTWGYHNNAESFLETVLGRWDTNYSPKDTTAWFDSDRLFVIGNGSSSTNRSDALVMLKNGNTSLNGNLDLNGSLDVSGDTELDGELCVNDDILASGNFKYKTPQTRKLQLHAYEFITSQSSGHDLNYYGDVSGTWEVNGTSLILGAPVRLPAGSTVTKLTINLYQYNEEGQTQRITGVTGYLRKRNAGSPTSTLMASVNESNSGGVALAQIDTTISSPSITEDHQVFLQLQIVTNNGGGDVGLLGATIEYTTDCLD